MPKDGELDLDSSIKALSNLVLTVPSDDEGSQSDLHWFYFVVMAIIEIVVFFNLLIAIISDTYDKV